MPTDGIGERPAFTPEQIEEHNITPEELERAGQTPEPTPDSAKILGKFNSQEDLANAYQELEKKLHEAPKNKVDNDDKSPTNAPSEESSELDENEGDESTADTPEQEGSAVGSAFEALQQAGELTDDIVERFEEAGIPKELVAHVAELEQFKAESELKSIQEGVGGEGGYNSMVNWAADNLSENEITTFNNIIENGTADEIRFAVTNLNGRMANTTQPQKSKLIKADAISAASTGYPSQAHMLADMNDPRYHNDPSFRDKVMAKANKSNW